MAGTSLLLIAVLISIVCFVIIAINLFIIPFLPKGITEILGSFATVFPVVTNLILNLQKYSQKENSVKQIGKPKKIQSSGLLQKSFTIVTEFVLKYYIQIQLLFGLILLAVI